MTRDIFYEDSPRRWDRPEEGAEDPSIKTNKPTGNLGGPRTKQYTQFSV